MDTQSIGAFIQNMLLYFTEQGLGSLWINDVYYAKNEIEKFFTLGNLELIAAITVGYSNQEKKFNLRNNLDEIII